MNKKRANQRQDQIALAAARAALMEMDPGAEWKTGYGAKKKDEALADDRFTVVAKIAPITTGVQAGMFSLRVLTGQGKVKGSYAYKTEEEARNKAVNKFHAEII